MLGLVNTMFDRALATNPTLSISNPPIGALDVVTIFLSDLKVGSVILVLLLFCFFFSPVLIAELLHDKVYTEMPWQSNCLSFTRYLMFSL